MSLAMLCILGLCALGWAQNQSAAKPSGNASILQSEPALQVKLTVKFKRPKAQDIVDRLSIATKLDLALADNIDRERPVYVGLDFYNVPAWIILDQLAKSKIIQGKWERNGKGYRLTSPLPPPGSVGAESIFSSGPPRLVLRYFLFTFPVIAVFAIMLLRRRRRSQQAIAASERRVAPKKFPSSAGHR